MFSLPVRGVSHLTPNCSAIVSHRYLRILSLIFIISYKAKPNMVILIMNIGTDIFKINALLPHLSFTHYSFSTHIPKVEINFTCFAVFVLQKINHRTHLTNGGITVNKVSDHTLPPRDVYWLLDSCGIKMAAVAPLPGI